MKKIILLCVLCLTLVLPCNLECAELPRRCLFVSVIQEPPVLSSRSDVERLVEFAKTAGFNKIFVQIYFANKAWFRSELADSTPYNQYLKKISGDPLDLLINRAHAAGIEVHAWMNMLSLGANSDAYFLKKYGPEILTTNLKTKKSLRDYMIDSQFFLEPGDLRVRNDLSDIVEEALRNYPGLDGVLFDYIRYPDEHPFYGYTKINMERYRIATGNKVIAEDSFEWKDWKRRQVTEVLESLYDRARAVRPGIKISATGCMPYSRAYLEAYQDWPDWIARGLVEYVTIMSYSPDPAEFSRTITAAKEKTVDFQKVNIAIGAYRLTQSPNAFIEEFRISENSGAGGFAVFHYGSLLENRTLVNTIMKSRKQSS